MKSGLVYKSLALERLSRLDLTHDMQTIFVIPSYYYTQNQFL